MPKLPVNKHSWISLSSEKGVQCEKCEYRVISVPANDPETRGGSRHVPGERAIYTIHSDIDDRVADHLCTVWGVICNS